MYPFTRGLAVTPEPTNSRLLTYDAGPAYDLAGDLAGFRPCVAGQSSSNAATMLKLSISTRAACV